mmetsp:Transcript_75997/g.198207  ORF Transcript_75997/g.198207 Transcript_75997/m.198207 type:complete len:201 (+) Transcript_75997:2-604(+)
MKRSRGGWLRPARGAVRESARAMALPHQTDASAEAESGGGDGGAPPQTATRLLSLAPSRCWRRLADRGELHLARLVELADHLHSLRRVLQHLVVADGALLLVLQLAGDPVPHAVEPLLDHVRLLAQRLHVLHELGGLLALLLGEAYQLDQVLALRDPLQLLEARDKLLGRDAPVQVGVHDLKESLCLVRHDPKQPQLQRH